MSIKQQRTVLSNFQANSASARIEEVRSPEISSLSEREVPTVSTAPSELEKSKSKSQSNTILNDQCIKSVPSVQGEIEIRKRVFCTVRILHPTVLKHVCYRRVLPICLEQGTEARGQTIQEHLKSKAHQECLKAERLNKLSAVAKSQEVPLVKILTLQRQKLANKIGSLIIHVYNDAKCLTTTAFSWPSRVIAAKIAHQFNYSEPFTPYNPSDFDLQYIRPPVVQELLRTSVCRSSSNEKRNRFVHIRFI